MTSDPSISAAVVLAAGKSTRMKSNLPKVLHEVCGRPMLASVLDACREAGVGRIVVVVGHQKHLVIEAFASEPDLLFVEQTEQKGTGHAVQMAEPALAQFDGDVLVIAGDMPLVRAETLRELLNARRAAGAAAAIATTLLDDPAGYGRIVRDDTGEFLGIVEDRDCTPEQRAIREVNPSYYCFERAALFDALRDVKPNNAKNEYYITDVLTILRQRGRRVIAPTQAAAEDATGINSRVELALVNRLLQRRIAARLMADGVTIVNPELTWIEAGAVIGPETIVEPLTFIGRGARVGAGCRIGPLAAVPREARIADGQVVSANLSGAAGDGAVVRLSRMTAASHGRASG